MAQLSFINPQVVLHLRLLCSPRPETFLVVTKWGRGVPLAARGQRLGTFLNTLQCTGQPPPTMTYQNGTSAEAEEPCSSQVICSLV